ncbi:MAG: hypothetical protein ACJ76V_14385 [Thermoleophilaceae bacterium]
MRLAGLAILGALLLAVPATAAAAPPDTRITTGPDKYTTSKTPQFAFESTVPGSTFQCRVNYAGWAPCTSPFTVDARYIATYVFEVRAIGPGGEADPTAAFRRFHRGDIFPPVVKLTNFHSTMKIRSFKRLTGTAVGTLGIGSVQVSVRDADKRRVLPHQETEQCISVDLETGRRSWQYCSFPQYARARGGPKWALPISKKVREHMKPGRYEIWVRATNVLGDGEVTKFVVALKR